MCCNIVLRIGVGSGSGLLMLSLGGFVVREVLLVVEITMHLSKQLGFGFVTDVLLAG